MGYPATTDVIRRIGGLEGLLCSLCRAGYVIRRIGGLEA